ncbi:MAG: hypothetical protein Q8P38_10020, partial [Candidatus Nanopelagicales bacterium]|nr:hypothetical protein [Candidatus Nanopelagicales bacterium]
MSEPNPVRPIFKVLLRDSRGRTRTMLITVHAVSARRRLDRLTAIGADVWLEEGRCMWRGDLTRAQLDCLAALN